jgi:hypothetical protein
MQTDLQVYEYRICRGCVSLQVISIFIVKSKQFYLQITTFLCTSLLIWLQCIGEFVTSITGRSVLKSPPYMSYHTSQQVQMFYRELHLAEEGPEKQRQYSEALYCLCSSTFVENVLHINYPSHCVQPKFIISFPLPWLPLCTFHFFSVPQP